MNSMVHTYIRYVVIQFKYVGRIILVATAVNLDEI